MDHPTTKVKNMNGAATKQDDGEQYGVGEATIDQEEMEEATQARSAEEVMVDAHGLYQRKNADYGDSWRLVGKTLALWCEHQGVDELTIPVHPTALNSFGLFTRRLDKMIRHFNGEFLTDDLRVDESIAETTEDQVPYAAMHTQIVEEMTYEDLL